MVELFRSHYSFCL